MNLVRPQSPVLWKPCDRVTDYTKQVLPHLIPMNQLMRRKHGAGLAAPQVGISLRFFITNDGHRRCIINPEWLPARNSPDFESLEGCLSFPKEKPVKVRRHTQIAVYYETTCGVPIAETLTGQAALVFQHECDHLNGVCIYPKP